MKNIYVTKQNIHKHVRHRRMQRNGNRNLTPTSKSLGYGP